MSGPEVSRKERYEAYLKSPEWRRKRLAAPQRAEHRCQVCYSHKRLDVHHRTYVRFGEEHDADLTVLCRRCHELFHHKGGLRDKSQSQAAKKRQRRQKRAAKRWAERPSSSVRRQQLAAAVLREQREEEAP